MDTSNSQDTVELIDPDATPEEPVVRRGATRATGAAPISNGNGNGSSATPPTDDEDAAPSTPGPRRRRRWLRWVIAVPLALLVLLVAAWGIDTATGGEQVARNTELAGTPVGGMSPAELDAAVADLAAELPATPVAIDTPDLELDSTAGALGIGIDTEATSEAVLDTGSTSNVVLRPFEWAASFFSPRSAEVVLQVDETAMGANITQLEGDRRTAPIEPTLVEQEGRVALSPGVDGVELRAAAVTEALPETLGDVSEAIEVSTERTVVPPTLGDDQIQPLVDQANGIIDATIAVKAGDQEFTLAGKDLLGGYQVDTSTGTPVLSISEDVMGMQIAAQRPDVNANPTDVRFDISGGTPTPVAGHDAQICCGEGAAAMIVQALLAGQPTVEVPTRTLTAAEGVEWASGLGVSQMVAEFTTPHKCCEGRVTNIHNISDTLRGILIPPGATFSVNDTTGRRTAEKGYVSAPVIIDGKHEQDIGGGVSQFATTMFNAAFFAGLDIPEYKMHSEYISRYPYGREATLFYPEVDLKIHNNSPYGVVIWPTYTGTSVTVQLWSTPYARGEQTAQSRSSGCGSVTTERTRTFPDGHTETDTFKNTYRCV